METFRELLRQLEREIFFHNTETCCRGISLARCHTLMEIEKQSPVSVSDLAICLGLDRSTVSRTVDGLVKSGMVERTIPEDDRRTTILTLTRSGEEMCDSINEKSNALTALHLEGFSEAEQKQLSTLLAKLTENMKKTRENSPTCQ